jgi:hypothetical protein
MFQPFYHGTLKRYTILFGTLFNSLVISRTNSANTVSSYKVPLAYAAKDPMLTRINADPVTQKDIKVSVPAMSFDRGFPSYNDDRHLNSIQKVVRRNDADANKFKFVYNPVAVDIPFNLYIYVTHQEDGDKIIEQIIPYFTPGWSASVNIIPELNIVNDVEIVWLGGSAVDNYESDFTSNRTILYTMNFVMKACLYGPTKNRPIIKYVKNNFFFGNPAENDASDVVSRIEVQPGMLANGNPTSNSAASVSPEIIYVNDDWDYCVDQSGLIITTE